MEPILNINRSIFNNYNRYGKLIGVNNKGNTYEKIYHNGNIRVLTCVSPLGVVLKTVTKYLSNDYAKIVAKDMLSGNKYTLTRNAQKAKDATKITITNKNGDVEEKVKLKKDKEGSIYIDYDKSEKKLGKKLNLYEVWTENAYSYFGIKAKQKGKKQSEIEVYEIAEDVYLPKQTSITLNNQRNVLYGAPLVSYTTNIDKHLAENLVKSFHNKFTSLFGHKMLSENK